MNMYFNGQGRPIDVDGYANTLPASMEGTRHHSWMKIIFTEMLTDWVVDYHKKLQDGTIAPSLTHTFEMKTYNNKRSCSNSNVSR